MPKHYYEYKRVPEKRALKVPDDIDASELSFEYASLDDFYEDVNDARDSLIDISEFAKVTLTCHTPNRKKGRIENDPEWYGVSSYDDAYNKALYGDHKKTKLIKESQRDITKAFNELSDVNQYRYDVTGLVFECEKVITGEPECWLNKQPVKAKPVIDVAISASMLADIEGKTIINRGGLILSLIEHFQRQKFRVNVKIYSCTENVGLDGNKKLNISWNVPSNPIDVEAVSFSIANPAFQRVFNFMFRENLFIKNEAYCYIELGGSALIEGKVLKDNPEFNGFIFESGVYRRIKELNEKFKSSRSTAKLLDSILKEFEENKIVTI